jgi:hypothetical protein
VPLSFKLGAGDEISRKVSPHDISIVGQILVHLRNPLESLRQVALVTKKTMITVPLPSGMQPVEFLLAPSGDWIAFSNDTMSLYHRELWRVNIDGTGLKQPHFPEQSRLNPHHRCTGAGVLD